MANLHTIRLEMRDLVIFACQLPNVCPKLRQIYISATFSGLWVCEIAGGSALYTSTWTRDLVFGSRWYRVIRPLSGLEDACVTFPSNVFCKNCIYTLGEQENIRKNTTLLQALFTQSATRPRPSEESSGSSSLPAPGLLHDAPGGAGSTG